MMNADYEGLGRGYWTPVAVVAAAVIVEPTILDTFVVGSAR